jgi:hypothetical protein
MPCETGRIDRHQPSRVRFDNFTERRHSHVWSGGRLRCGRRGRRPKAERGREEERWQSTAAKERRSVGCLGPTERTKGDNEK